MKKLFVMLSCCLMLAACGSGGGGTPNSNQPLPDVVLPVIKNVLIGTAGPVKKGTWVLSNSTIMFNGITTTKTYSYIVDSSGNVSDMTISDPTNSSNSSYSYDSKGNVILKTTTTNMGTTTELYTYVYNTNGAISSKTITTNIIYGSNHQTMITTCIYSYSPTGVIIDSTVDNGSVTGKEYTDSNINYTKLVMNNSELASYINTYTADNLLSSVKMYLASKLEYERIYNYNTSGKLIETIQTSYSGSPTTTTTYSYDGNGNISTVIEKSGDIITGTSMYTYTML